MADVCKCSETQARRLAALGVHSLSAVWGLMTWLPSLLHRATLSSQPSNQTLPRGIDRCRGLLERCFAGLAMSLEPGAGARHSRWLIQRDCRDLGGRQSSRLRRAGGSGARVLIPSQGKWTSSWEASSETHCKGHLHMKSSSVLVRFPSSIPTMWSILL